MTFSRLTLFVLRSYVGTLVYTRPVACRGGNLTTLLMELKNVLRERTRYVFCMYLLGNLV